MPNLQEISDDNGRINYEMLMSYLLKVTLTDFINEVKHPLLVGKQLYEGDLREPKVPTKTMKFRLQNLFYKKELIANSTSNVPESVGNSNSISRAIYMLRKKSFSQEKADVISIGRVSSNDVVIADYTISRQHAQIIIFHDKYFLIDFKSTNGTRVDKQLIPPNVKVKIEIDSLITFGRFSFVFTSPYDMYQGIRRESFKFV